VRVKQKGSEQPGDGVRRRPEPGLRRHVLRLKPNLARLIGVVAGFLAVLAYGNILSLRLAVPIFLVFASCLVFLAFIWPNLRRGK
jgi:hypothetical protein